MPCINKKVRSDVSWLQLAELEKASLFCLSIMDRISVLSNFVDYNRQNLQNPIDYRL